MVHTLLKFKGHHTHFVILTDSTCLFHPLVQILPALCVLIHHSDVSVSRAFFLPSWF